MSESETAFEALRRVDPDRRRAAMFADRETRENLLTLYAFHYELAKIPEWVSEPMVGMIRYQWWRDTVAEIYEGRPVRAHEVATPLAKVLRDNSVTRFEIDQLIDARQRDLEREPFGNLDAARAYARETSGRFMVIAARLCDAEKAAEYETAIFDLGAAWGLTGMVRSWRFYHDGILKGLAFEDILAATEQALEQAQKSMPKLPSELTPALAYGALVSGFVKRMRRPKFDPLQSDTGYGALSKQVKLMQTVLTGQF